MHSNYFIALLAAASSASAAVIRRDLATGPAAPACVTGSLAAVGELLTSMRTLNDSVCTWKGDLFGGLTINQYSQAVNVTCVKATTAIKSCPSAPWLGGDSTTLAEVVTPLVNVAKSALDCLNDDALYVYALAGLGAPAMVLKSLKDMDTANTNFQNACASAVIPGTDQAATLLQGAQEIKAKYDMCLSTYSKPS